jgi:hypothetical protein
MGAWRPMPRSISGHRDRRADGGGLWQSLWARRCCSKCHFRLLGRGRFRELLLPRPPERSWNDGCNGHHLWYGRSGLYWQANEASTAIARRGQ